MKKIPRIVKHLSFGNGNVVIKEKDYNWLVEQAKRVGELDSILEQDHRQEVIESMYEDIIEYRKAVNIAIEHLANNNLTEVFNALIKLKVGDEE